MLRRGAIAAASWSLWAAAERLDVESISRMALMKDSQIVSADHNLKIFSATYNAGNKNWASASAVSSLMEEMASGHQEADLAIFGFQEFRSVTQDRSTISTLLSDILWRPEGLQMNSSSSNVYRRLYSVVKARLLPFTEPDTSSKMQKFTLDLQNAFKFGSLTAEEVQELQLPDVQGPVEVFNDLVDDPIDGLKTAVSGAIDDMMKVLKDYEALELRVGENSVKQMVRLSQRFITEEGPSGGVRLTNGDSLLCCCEKVVEGKYIQCHLASSCDERTKFSWNHVKDIPVLKTFKGAGDCIIPADNELLQRVYPLLPSPLKFLTTMLEQVIPIAMERVTEYISINVVDQLGIFNNNDLLNYDEKLKDGDKKGSALGRFLDMQARAAALHFMHMIKSGERDNLGDFGGIFGLFTSLGQIATANEVRTTGAASVWTENTFCYNLPSPHYDTGMYMYVNPQSGWEATFPSANDKDNKWVHVNKGIKECGKVVNGMRVVLKKVDPVTQERVTVSVCGLNTHMSFAKTAAARQGYIHAAVKEAYEKRKCNVVVFVGDFNSRLHCEADDGCRNVCSTSDGKKDGCTCSPIFDIHKVKKARKQEPQRTKEHEKCFQSCKDSPQCKMVHWCPEKNMTCDVSGSSGGIERDGCERFVSTFTNMVETFCGISGCKLNGGKFLNDELSHILRSGRGEGDMACYEKDKGYFSGDGYNLITKSAGTLGLSEVGPVNFPPTYKVLDEKAKEKGKGDISSLLKQGLSYLFSDGVGKHNFAWTDRILVGSKKFDSDDFDSLTVLPSTDYGRIDFRKPESDHLPVTATFSVKVSSAAVTTSTGTTTAEE